jgi:hypothetical protein
VRTRTLTIPEIALIAGTRAALGAGAGLLLADRLSAEQRRAVGWTLFAVGVVSTLPLAAHVFVGGEGVTRRGARDVAGEGRSRTPQFAS